MGRQGKKGGLKIRKFCRRHVTSFHRRFDALDKRIVKDMELAEFYEANNNLEGTILI